MAIIKDKKNWAELLPRGTAKRIKEIIGDSITERQILRILSGKSSDNYGVLIIATKMSKEYTKEQEKLKNEFALLQSKKSQPLKSK